MAPLALWEAALGASIEVPTLTGKIALTVPAGSQSGKTAAGQGQGLAGKKEPGDLYVIQGGDAAEAEREGQRPVARTG